MKTAAVFTGVNVYQHYPQDTLRGCVNDANNLWLLARNRLDIPEENLIVLKDHLATAQRERDLVVEAAHKVGYGGRLIWSHSSHGSNFPDPDQKDGMQEVLLCYDSKEIDGIWEPTSCHTAWWIGKLCRELSWLASIDLIFDCCHAPAGDQLKSMGLRYDRTRFMRRSALSAPVRPKLIQVIQSATPDNVALWGACEPAQTSADSYIDNSWQGAFTAAFLKAWKKGRTRSDIIYYARQWLKAEGYSQVPHLYAWKKLAFQIF
jgi:hypothetical protein